MEPDPGDLDGLVLGMSATVALAVLTEADKVEWSAVNRALMTIGVEPQPYALFHTRLGQPRLRVRKGMGRPGDAHPVVSFSDEGPLRVVAAAKANDVVGLGLDILDTRRFDRYRTDAAARRHMERRLCHPDEVSEASTHHHIHPGDALAIRFALKEATSKALGTGLRLGLGLGARDGVSPDDIRVVPTPSGADVRLAGRAARRMARIGASSVESRRECLGALLIAVVLLRR